ncbi:hypothetical protein DFH06DRAFT_1118544 [Mycena polygramma]|nr:hypothetical protein DFH06DRAFT_1118544 [Mycena polygramma]
MAPPASSRIQDHRWAGSSVPPCGVAPLRVERVRAEARMPRWDEELKIIREEMLSREMFVERETAVRESRERRGNNATAEHAAALRAVLEPLMMEDAAVRVSQITAQYFGLEGRAYNGGRPRLAEYARGAGNKCREQMPTYARDAMISKNTELLNWDDVAEFFVFDGKKPNRDCGKEVTKQGVAATPGSGLPPTAESTIWVEKKASQAAKWYSEDWDVNDEDKGSRDDNRTLMSKIIGGQLWDHLRDRGALGDGDTDPTKFKMRWGAKFCDVAFENQCRVVEYPSALVDYHQIMGTSQYDGKKIKAETYKKFMPALIQANRTRDFSDVMHIEPWSDEDTDLPLDEQGDVALVISEDGEILRRVKDSTTYHKAVVDEQEKAKKKAKKKGKAKKADVRSPSPEPRSPPPGLRYAAESQYAQDLGHRPAEYQDEIYGRAPQPSRELANERYGSAYRRADERQPSPRYNAPEQDYYAPQPPPRRDDRDRAHPHVSTSSRPYEAPHRDPPPPPPRRDDRAHPHASTSSRPYEAPHRDPPPPPPRRDDRAQQHASTSSQPIPHIDFERAEALAARVGGGGVKRKKIDTANTDEEATRDPKRARGEQPAAIKKKPMLPVRFYGRDQTGAVCYANELVYVEHQSRADKAAHLWDTDGARYRRLPPNTSPLFEDEYEEARYRREIDKFSLHDFPKVA